MLIIAMLAAGAIEPPTPITPEKWFLVEDYPFNAMMRRVHGITKIRLTVDPEGKPAKCVVVRRSGSSDLDRASCSVLMRRGRFKPARNEQGQAIYGAFHRIVSWHIPDGSPFQTISNIDLDLTVKALPKGVSDPVVVSINVLINEAGSIEACTTNAEDEKIAPLPAIACREITRAWEPTPLNRRDGVGTKFAQSINVSFAIEKTSQIPK